MISVSISRDYNYMSDGVKNSCKYYNFIIVIIIIIINYKYIAIELN